MNAARPFAVLFAAFAALHFSGCSKMQITHVTPGKSARAALAERDSAQHAVADGTMPQPATTQPGQEVLPPLPTGDVKMPAGTVVAEGVADAYTRGTFAMQAGQNAEAISAFEQAVKLDPDFTDAWGKLAILYHKDGQSAKATDAFKKAKRLGDANGGTVTRDASGGLQLP